MKTTKRRPTNARLQVRRWRDSEVSGSIHGGLVEVRQRASNGAWSARVWLRLDMVLPDGRTIEVDQEVDVAAKEVGA